MKRNYEVNLNWHGEHIKMFTYARKESEALSNCIVRLAKSLGVYQSKVRSYFYNGRDNYSIKEVLK